MRGEIRPSKESFSLFFELYFGVLVKFGFYRSHGSRWFTV